MKLKYIKMRKLRKTMKKWDPLEQAAMEIFAGLVEEIMLRSMGIPVEEADVVDLDIFILVVVSSPVLVMNAKAQEDLLQIVQLVRRRWR